MRSIAALIGCSQPTEKRMPAPLLLDFPAPKLNAYSKESVVAKKLHAMVVLGMANSRTKDFYDVLANPPPTR